MLEGNYSAYDVNNNKIENILLSIKIEQQNRINQSSCNPLYNNFQEKLIEIIDDMLINTPQVNEENITNRISDNLQIRNEIILTKKKNTNDMNKILQCRLEQECINYLLYIINHSKKEYAYKPSSINILTWRIKNWFNRGLNLIWMLN
ncbi:MAG TPA: hypothetical protein VJ697_16840 [Nitrososphaeraceae archaeon]|nr:hypothetical protein [Nitrososphaeraceae archaeon]